MKQNKIFLYLLVASIFVPLACAPAKPPKQVTLSSAQEKFLKICREELKYDVFVIPDGKTMWVYVPLSDGIVDFRAAPKNQAPKAPADKIWTINNLEAKFENKVFTISYDISLTKKYDHEVTFQNKYTEDYNKKQRDILTTLTRSYFDVGQRNIDTSLVVGKSDADKDHDKVVEKMTSNAMMTAKDETPPEFFVMVFADTKRGVAVKATNYFGDMRMALSNPPGISNEEYIKRYVSEIYGDEDMIGDKTGAHLKISEIVLGEFLAKQLENRIKYEFTQSGFPPAGEAQDAIWNIVAQTCKAYQFKDFEKIKLVDLTTAKEFTYNQNQLQY